MVNLSDVLMELAAAYQVAVNAIAGLHHAALALEDNRPAL